MTSKLEPGASAPGFDLPGTAGQNVSLASLRGKKVVLYFYPEDDTPGCTQESCDFRDNLGPLRDAGAEVIGVSQDPLESHARFKTKFDLPFVLLTDEGNAVAKAYGAYGEKNLYGRIKTGIIRSTFLIDEAGKIAAVWSPVRVPGHVEKVLAAVKGEAPPKRPRKA